MGYDLTGPQVHADGDIWSATNFEMRKAFIKKYNKNFPAGNQALQERCAEGKTKLNECPGNRRWMQVVFDAWLLMPARTSFLDARDAYLAADKMRTKGAHEKIMWNVFSKRGFGQDAKTVGGTDENVTPSFKNPVGSNGTISFKAVNAAGKKIKAQFYVGRYQARVTPVANFDKRICNSSSYTTSALGTLTTRASGTLTLHTPRIVKRAPRKTTASERRSSRYSAG